MKQFYREHASGFEMFLDLSLYARQAVMKAFYLLQGSYTIAYERRGKFLHAFFEPVKSGSADFKAEAENALRLVQYEMLRYDTMRRTSHIRELLVGRALYATCVEVERPQAAEEVEETGSWKDDAAHILESWNG
jgi:His-Xaa-Ser system protein HxsD